MLTAEQIRAKVFGLADEFDRLYNEKKYAQAKYAYDTASTMAVFMELPQEDMYELFMNHAPDNEETPEWGLFNRDKVHACYLWCIRNNQTREIQPYHGPMAPGTKELAV